MNNEKGLTLIEVLATVTILGIVILAFTQLSANYRLSDVQSDRFNEASIIIEQIINDIRYDRSSYTDLATLLSTKQTLYNNMYTPKYQFFIQSKTAALTETFANPCSPSEKQTSIPFTMFVNNTTTIISVTACWSK